MKQQLQQALVLAFALSLCTAIASADLIPVGTISIESSGFTFDGGPLFDFVLTNETGTNASTFPVTTWPVETSLGFLDLSLSVDGSSANCTLVGNCGILSLVQNVMTATLSGEFNLTTVTLNDGPVLDIAPNAFFGSTGLTPPTITDATGACTGGGTGCLHNGDSAVIYAEVPSATAPVPEPYSVVLLATVCATLLPLRRRMKWNDVD